MFCCPIFRKKKEPANYKHDDEDELYNKSAINMIPFKEDVNNITLDLVENTKQNLNNDLDYFRQELNKETNELIDISNEIEESVETLVDETQQYVKDTVETIEDIKESTEQHVEDIVEIIEDIKESTEQHVEDTVDEITDKYFKNKNSHLKTITELNEQEDYVHSREYFKEEDFDSNDLDDTEKSYYSEVTTYHCNLCGALIFYNKYDKVVSRRCEKCLLKYMN